MKILSNLILNGDKFDGKIDMWSAATADRNRPPDGPPPHSVSNTNTERNYSPPEAESSHLHTSLVYRKIPHVRYARGLIIFAKCLPNFLGKICLQR